MGKMGTTRFELGQLVLSTVTAQGLEMGAVYKVVELTERSTFVGNFVTYTVEPAGGGRVQVGNGHLVLTEVEQAQVCEHCEEYLHVPGDVYCVGCVESFREVEEDNKRIEAARRDQEVAAINARLGLGPKRGGIVLVAVVALSSLLGACATTAPTPQVEAVGALAPSYHSISTAPVHATTDLSPGVQAVSTDEDVPSAVVGAGEVESPDVAPKGGLTMGGVR